MSCNIGEATEGLENELWHRWSDGRGWRRLWSFSNPSITSPTSQIILLISQPFCRFIYVTAHYPTLPLVHLHHSSFSNPSFASPTSQALHLIHLSSRPCHFKIDENRAFRISFMKSYLLPLNIEHVTLASVGWALMERSKCWAQKWCLEARGMERDLCTVWKIDSRVTWQE